MWRQGTVVCLDKMARPTMLMHCEGDALPVATSHAEPYASKHTGTPKATKERFGEPLQRRLSADLRTLFKAKP